MKGLLWVILTFLFSTLPVHAEITFSNSAKQMETMEEYTDNVTIQPTDFGVCADVAEDLKAKASEIGQEYRGTRMGEAQWMVEAFFFGEEVNPWRQDSSAGGLYSKTFFLKSSSGRCHVSHLDVLYKKLNSKSYALSPDVNYGKRISNSVCRNLANQYEVALASLEMAKASKMLPVSPSLDVIRYGGVCFAIKDHLPVD